MSTWTVETSVVQHSSNTDYHYQLCETDVILGTSEFGCRYSDGADTEAEALRYALQQITDQGAYEARTPSVAHGVTCGEAGHTLYDIMDPADGELVQIVAVRIYEVPDQVIHVRQTRDERDSTCALADCYCGPSPYAISDFDTTITYNEADRRHFAGLCPDCVAAIEAETARRNAPAMIVCYVVSDENGHCEDDGNGHIHTTETGARQCALRTLRECVSESAWTADAELQIMRCTYSDEDGLDDRTVLYGVTLDMGHEDDRRQAERVRKFDLAHGR